MPQYSLKLCTYDPSIIDAFDRLRRNRKQAAFTHEALKEFLSSEKGRLVLHLMEGKAPEPSSSRDTIPSSAVPVRLKVERSDSISSAEFDPQSDCKSVLNSIFE